MKSTLLATPPLSPSPRSSLRILGGLLPLLWLIAPLAKAQTGGETAGVVAEIWPLEEQHAADAAPGVFAKWRSEVPPVKRTSLSLEKLEIPAREVSSMVRVRGVLVPPKTGGYSITLEGVDTAELWLLDDVSHEWGLAQRNGNPNTGVGRLKLEQGTPKSFEYWTMGRGKASVKWESVILETEATAREILVEKQVIPGASMQAPREKPGDRLGNGLSDEWKLKWGLDPASGEGPNSPFGDFDSDGLLNWQEQISQTNPKKADAEGRAGLVRWEVWRSVPGKYVFTIKLARPPFPSLITP